MEEPVREIVHALKYGGWKGAATPMAERMRSVSLPRDVHDEVRRVIPVPTSGVRLRERGYNQAERLASAFAHAAQLTCTSDLLVRERTMQTQTGLHPDERRANVAQAFSVPSAGARPLAGEHVLLIDDVWTTGATACACAEALLAAGARMVSVLTFARALPDRRDGRNQR
ncbi:hypothetical protein BH23GEM3_BH23GEM3_17880 [soil metagenome]|jgi:ComF family protein|nr:ComF family protein [Gemmatimonadota bacterium]